MANLTDADVKNLQKKEIRESLGRGRGALLFRKVAETTTGYYCYRNNQKRRFIKLGTYSSAREKASGFTLQELRDKALNMSRVRQEVEPEDLKNYLERLEQERAQAELERQRLAEIEASHGTLKDLCDSYVSSLEQRKSTGAKNVKNLLNCYCLTPFPAMAKKKARDITTDDMVSVIRRMIDQGITTTCNRVRSCLHAAFAHGMKADNDPFLQSKHGKRFAIPFNPVSSIPRQAHFENIRERRLSDSEIREMWFNLGRVEGTERSSIYSLLLKFCLACYGNRPQQLMRCRWSDYDEHQRTLTFIDSKGKTARPKQRVIPLSGLAIGLLEELRDISGEYEFIFSLYGKKPITTSTLGHAVSDFQAWLMSKAKQEGRTVPARWTSKDLRTTATSLLTRLRIPKEQRYLLQSREDGSIESKHYDHDDRLIEKREAARRYTKELERILEGKEEKKLVDMEEYRQNLKF